MTLVECGDHKLAPSNVICIHLFNGTSTEWCPISSGDPQTVNDWLCPDCIQNLETLSVHDLRTVCMHCCRDMKAKSERREKE